MENSTIKIEIYWDDLTDKKQEELIEESFYDENFKLYPIAIIEIEKQNSDETKNKTHS